MLSSVISPDDEVLVTRNLPTCVQTQVSAKSPVCAFLLVLFSLFILILPPKGAAGVTPFSCNSKQELVLCVKLVTGLMFHFLIAA